MRTVYDRSREKGESFAMGMRRALGAALVSPAFLLKSEQAKDTDESYRVDEYELASRLSYFLWASMPDDELFRLAAEKRLAKPDVLARQVTRMLSDPKSDTLGSVFAAQPVVHGHADGGDEKGVGDGLCLPDSG